MSKSAWQPQAALSANCHPLHSVSITSIKATQLKIYREPRAKDWQIFVPHSIDARVYESLEHCIATQRDEIRRRLSVSRPPHDLFPSPERTPPEIATIRHANLFELRKQYACEPDGGIEIQENGRVYLRRHDIVLIGSVVDDGKSIVLIESALRYLRQQEDGAIAEPLAYFRRCGHGQGASMFHDFAVSTSPDDIVWAELGR